MRLVISDSYQWRWDEDPLETDVEIRERLNGWREIVTVLVGANGTWHYRDIDSAMDDGVMKRTVTWTYEFAEEDLWTSMTP
jgi:hypothetical protein